MSVRRSGGLKEDVLWHAMEIVLREIAPGGDEASEDMAEAEGCSRRRKPKDSHCPKLPSARRGIETGISIPRTLAATEPSVKPCDRFVNYVQTAVSRGWRWCQRRRMACVRFLEEGF